MRNIEGLTEEETIQFFEWYLKKGFKGVYFCTSVLDFLSIDCDETLSNNCFRFIKHWIKKLGFPVLKRKVGDSLFCGLMDIQIRKQFARELLKHLKNK